MAFITSPLQSAPPLLKASIHIGASSVSLLVVNTHPEADGTSGDFLEQSLPLARDIFQQGSIRKATIERCVTILNGYQESLRELGATEETPIRAVVTNIVIEASNQDAFLNRIQIGCGMVIETLDEGEMTRLIYLKTRRRLHDTPSLKTSTSLVVHVGPGNTRALLFKKGRISQYSNYRLGVYRTSQAIETDQLNDNNGADLTQAIDEHIHSQVSQIHNDYIDAGIEEIVIIGYEVQQIADTLTSPSQTKNHYLRLRKTASEIAAIHEEIRVGRFQLDYTTAQAIVPALEINLAIAKTLEIKTLRIPSSNYESGLLGDIHTSFSITEGFRNEVLRSAETLAKKFRVHRAHSTQVAQLSQQIFDATSALHQLDEHDELLLRCAAIVHECGNFISSRSHHKHSYHIIQNSEIFGLGAKDLNLVAQVARYHRKSGPRTSHSAYRDLRARDRMKVSKLAAILRIADALDHTHTSRVGELAIALSTQKQKLIITLLGIGDASAERLAMKNKADLFENIFGLSVSLKEQPTQ